MDFFDDSVLDEVKTKEVVEGRKLEKQESNFNVMNCWHPLAVVAVVFSHLL